MYWGAKWKQGMEETRRTSSESVCSTWGKCFRCISEKPATITESAAENWPTTGWRAESIHQACSYSTIIYLNEAEAQEMQKKLSLPLPHNTSSLDTQTWTKSTYYTTSLALNIWQRTPTLHRKDLGMQNEWERKKFSEEQSHKEELFLNIGRGKKGGEKAKAAALTNNTRDWVGTRLLIGWKFSYSSSSKILKYTHTPYTLPIWFLYKKK